ncbi:MAG: hypothetical protein QOH76_2905 [Thermoleophilaceae bacterium]|jgi:uncharacterized membrane protein|nr:hypothetical protein [Thermoleophilaceae bacterium]
MCPTPIGRLHTRTAIFVGPALIGLIFSLVSGHWDWLVLVGVYFMLAIFLDSAIYPWLLKWQPPWMGGVLAVAEFGLLLVLAGILNDKTGGLHNISIGEAIWFYWLCWIVAAITKIVVLPIASLTYVESAAEFRSTEWSVPPPLEPLPILASSEEAKAGPGPVIREASGVHAKPLEPLPSPSGVHRLPPQPA